MYAFKVFCSGTLTKKVQLSLRSLYREYETNMTKYHNLRGSFHK
jgi:hypothetical protein